MTKDFPSEALRGALQKKAAPWLRALLLALSTAVFFGFAYHARAAILDNYGSWQMASLTLMTAVLFTSVYALSLGVQLRFAKGQPVIVCLLLAVIANGLVLMRVSSYYQNLIFGLILLLSIVLDKYRQRLSENKK